MSNGSSIHDITQVSKNKLYDYCKAISYSPLSVLLLCYIINKTPRNMLYFTHKTNSKHPTAAVPLLVVSLCFNYQQILVEHTV